MTNLNNTGTFAVTTNENYNTLPSVKAKSFRVSNFSGKVVGVRRRHKSLLVDDFNDVDFTEWTGDIGYESSELEGTGAAKVTGTAYRPFTRQIVADGAEVDFQIRTPGLSPYQIKFSVIDKPERLGLTPAGSLTVSDNNTQSNTKYIVTIRLNPSTNTYEAFLKLDDEVVLSESGDGVFWSNNYQFDRLFAFGNSYTDSGNYPDEYWEDKENVWVQYLAESLSLPLTSSGVGGTNYAYGGAKLTQTYTQGAEPFLTIPSIESQIQSAPLFSPTDLVAFFGGGNDYLGDGADANYISSGIQSNLELLISKGAKNIVLLNMVNLLTMPAVTDASAQQIAQDVNTQINDVIVPGLLANSDVSIYTVDLYTIVDSIVADPTSYGIEGNPFYDDVHLVEEVHKVISDNAYSLLPKSPLIAIEAGTSVVVDPIIYKQKVDYSVEHIGHGGTFVYPCKNLSEYEIVNLGSDAMNYSDNTQTISVSGFYVG